jgi:hypothetical protein
LCGPQNPLWVATGWGVIPRTFAQALGPTWLHPIGSFVIRFALVVDDFAVIWRDKIGMNHFIKTLRKLYTVKIDWH